MPDDLGHKLTERELDKLIKRIRRVYSEAQVEASATVDKYWGKLVIREKDMLAKLEKGVITEAEFKTWKMAQIGRGRNLETVRDNIALMLTNTNEKALQMVNNSMADIYALNANYSAYIIEGYSDAVSFSLLDGNTVRRLVVDNPDLMPYYPEELALKRGFDLQYGKTKILENVRSGILQGLSIPEISDKLTSSVVGMSQVSAVRAARTAVTGAQNAGRQATYEKATQMGLSIQKEWLATLDGRTRTSHQHLDGERVPYNKPFSNGLMFPADPTGGKPAEIYNCRCTMFAVLPETANDKRITYDEWIEQKQEEADVGEISDVIEIDGKIEKLKSILSEDEYNEFVSLLNNHSNIANLFAEYGDTPEAVMLNEKKCCVSRKNRTVSVRVNNEEDRQKFETIGHEFGHWFDEKIASADDLTYNIIDNINDRIGIKFESYRFYNCASSSDVFLKACIEDVGNLSPDIITKALSYISKERTLIDATSGVQDGFDAFFGMKIWWGHGDAYYNDNWDAWFTAKYHGKDGATARKNELKNIMSEFGVNLRTDKEAKQFFRIFDGSKELWANIQQYELNGGIGKEWMLEYFPNAYNEYLNIIGGIYGAI